MAKCTTPKPTTTKPATTQAEKHPTVGNWRKAYTNFLKKYLAEADYPEACGFSLVYIDNDDAPELVIRDDNGHSAAAHVYTCINSKVVELAGDFSGTYGIIQYVEKGGLIYVDWGYQGHLSLTIYSVNADMCKKIISMYSDEAATPDTPTYKVNDKAVSKSKYERTLKKYKNSKTKSSNDSDMILTLDNIESIAS